MPSCCNARGCDGFFTPRMARRAAERHREKGVDKTARRMLDFLEGHGIEGATVLEIGGGVGEVQIELLKRGAACTERRGRRVVVALDRWTPVQLAETR